ncbi:MAG: cation:proton antiporter [Mogibacterium sp.]|nr:cation:proton antiporter [Mogibacterium sp.]
MEIPQLIIDLAIMLTTAAVVTIVFKRLRIPTILGYIVAGFLIGPHFPLFMNIESAASVETWSEIGVIIILFHIGLEFDFHKLSEIGSTAIVSAAVKMGGVMLVGYGFGILAGMSNMNAVFLGAMLSISSTVVIQKCFSEMGLEGEKYTGLVMGSLVMEDVIAVFMMVVLTTISASQTSDGSSMALRMFLMITYLVLWLVLGIFFLPTILDRTMELMSDETLTLLSLGFCFLMGMLAHWLGFSMELGAFIAGSLFAGTRHVHKVERVTAGIKDMFGAIFFLSVGMMVDPGIIAARWTSIVPIAILAVVAKLIFATIGMILSGQDPGNALRGGISLAPIGEFSFIIASLGISLGVMDSYLYPVIVAASILTIIITPVLIRNQDTIIKVISKPVPAKIKRMVRNYTSDQRSYEEHVSEWKVVLKDYLLKIAIYGSIMLVLTLVCCQAVYPALASVAGNRAAKIIVIVVNYLVLAVFAVPFMGNRSAAFTQLWMDRLANRPPLLVMILIKIVILELIALIPVETLFNINNLFIVLLIPLSVFLIARSDFIATYYLQLETRFFANLNQKTMEERGGARKRQHWLNEDYSIFSWDVPAGAPYEGKTIQELDWGRKDAVYVVKVRHGDKRIPMPPARTVLHAGDHVHVIGDKMSLETFYKTLGIDQHVNMRTLKEFLDEDYKGGNALSCAAIQVRGTEPYVGKPIKKSRITTRNHCMILGLERDGYATAMPDSNMLIEKGDILWIIGTGTSLSSIAAHSVGDTGTHSDPVTGDEFSEKGEVK